MAISNRLRRLFGRDGKRGKDKSGASMPADDRSPAASSSHVDDASPDASSRHDRDSDQVDAKGVPHERRSLVEEPKATPWAAVCYLVSDYGPEIDPQQGTGFLISDTTIITVAHNLWKNVNGNVKQPRSIAIGLPNRADPHHAVRKTAGLDVGQLSYESRYDRDYETLLRAQANTKNHSAEWKELYDRMSYIDYGAILLNARIDPRPAFFFDVCGAKPEDLCWNKALVSTGYSPKPGLPNKYELWHAKGGADRNHRFLGPNKNLVRHDASVEKGESGGPLLQGETAVGVQVRTEDRIGSEPPTYGAVRITKEMEDLFKAWNAAHRKSLGLDEDFIA